MENGSPVRTGLFFLSISGIDAMREELPEQTGRDFHCKFLMFFVYGDDQVLVQGHERLTFGCLHIQAWITRNILESGYSAADFSCGIFQKPSYQAFQALLIRFIAILVGIYRFSDHFFRVLE